MTHKHNHDPDLAEPLISHGDDSGLAFTPEQLW